MIKIQIDKKPYALKVDWYEEGEDIITFDDIEEAKLVKLVMETQKDLLRKSWNTYQCLSYSKLTKVLLEEIGKENLITQIKKVKLDEESKAYFIKEPYGTIDWVMSNFFKEHIEYGCPDMVEYIHLYSREVDYENGEIILKEIK